MKLIVAIIRPEKLEAVQAALNERDVYLMTVSDVRGCGRQRGYTDVYRETDVVGEGGRVRGRRVALVAAVFAEDFLAAAAGRFVCRAGEETGRGGRRQRTQEGRQVLHLFVGRLRPVHGRADGLADLAFQV